MRTLVSSGFSRAVRIGPFVSVTARRRRATPHGQAKRVLEIILAALAEVHFPAAARAHGEVFGTIRPACTVMVVTGFVDPDWLVEMEADAVVP